MSTRKTNLHHLFAFHSIKDVDYFTFKGRIRY